MLEGDSILYRAYQTNNKYRSTGAGNNMDLGISIISSFVREEISEEHTLHTNAIQLLALILNYHIEIHAIFLASVIDVSSLRLRVQKKMQHV